MTVPKEIHRPIITDLTKLFQNIKLLKRICSKFIMVTQQTRKHLMDIVMMNLSISILSVLLLTLLSSINKNNNHDCDITNTYEEKTVEAVITNSVLVRASDKEANLHLVETIDSTIDQFKALIEKARKFTVDNDFSVKDRARSS